jgi:hypothetical protein
MIVPEPIEATLCEQGERDRQLFANHKKVRVRSCAEPLRRPALGKERARAFALFERFCAAKPRQVAIRVQPSRLAPLTVERYASHMMPCTRKGTIRRTYYALFERGHYNS